MDSYSDPANRRPSTGTSIPSSRYTDSAFTCTRIRCHCSAANREETDPAGADSHSQQSQSQRRRADYFYRPPIIDAYSVTKGSHDSPYPYFHYEKLSEAEYCEQCQHCWALSRWCGRLPGPETEKTALPCLPDSSSGELTVKQKIPLPNATWVQEPLIVNAARVSDDKLAPMEDEQFVPAVFSHILTSQSLQNCPTRDVALLREEKNPSLDSIRPCRTQPQIPAKDCQRLRFCKDIRGARRDTWAFEEGSLVIGIHPSFVNLNQQLIQEDEFELRYGEVYIICRMFADKWALCARLRMSDTIMPVKHSDLVDHGFENIKFLPLCAVTLAANFASFDRRWSEYRMRCPYATSFPSGGLRVTPPARSDSLLASREIAVDNFRSLHVPWIVFHLCKPRIPLPANTEYIPLNPPKRRIGRLIDNTVNGRNTLGRMWRTLVLGDTPESTSQSENFDHYLEKEVDCLEDEQSSLSRGELEISNEKQPLGPNVCSPPVRKRKSVRQLFFFGGKRFKQVGMCEETQPAGKVPQDIESLLKVCRER